MNIFITGGTSGIGKNLTRLYLEEGHHVGICGGTKEQFSSSWDNPPTNLEFFELDVTNREETQKIIGEFKNGDIDLFIGSAGINQSGDNGPIPNFTLASKVIDINFKGMLHCLEAALTQMKKRNKGHLVAIASGSGFAGFPGAGAYCSSKAGVITFMESLTIDLKQFNINCSTICPGFVDTPLVAENGRKMPFLMKPEIAAKRIKKAIKNKKELYSFPTIVWFLMGIIRMMPRFIYRSLQKPARIEDSKS
jgi:short-subunit dehydrogenase